MSDALYDQYKDALRRGHLAAQRGRDAAALEAYSEAARLAPDRALPLVGLAGALRRLGKRDEAIAAYRAAVDRAPADEAALRGLAEVATERGDRLAAAEAYDQLATTLDGAGRLPDAAEAARQALEAAESRERRTTVQDYADRLAASGDDAAAQAALARATSALDARVSADAEPELEIDPIGAMDDLATAVDIGDAETARSLAIAIATRFRSADWSDSALDVCYAALAVTPADQGLHLALADLYLDRGWRPLAVEKLDRLVLLAELTDDQAGRDRACALVAERLPDEARLIERCA